MCKGQGVQRFQKGNILEHLSKGKATEAVNGPREASSGRVRWGPVGGGKSLDFILQAKESKSLKDLKLRPDRSRFTF